jgi:Ca-activated chloride channel family protein
MVWLVLLPLVEVSLPSQTTVPDSSSAVTTVQAKVRVVLVDVVVTGGKGDSVTGLHKEDFEVAEDGKPQTIASFAEHQAAPPTQINGRTANR